jgi:hypothetical protein
MKKEKQNMKYFLGICFAFIFCFDCNAEETTSEIHILKDGKVMAEIIVAKKNKMATDSAMFLKKYLDKVSECKFTIKNTPIENSNVKIFVGDCKQARANKLDVSELKRDGFYIAAIGNNIFIIGDDDKQEGIKHGLLKYKHATLLAVQFFLQKYCGIRWMKAGLYGEVVPKKKNIVIKSGIIKEEPYFAERYIGDISLKTNKYPDASKHATTKGKKYYYRYDLMHKFFGPGINNVAGCHSTIGLEYVERFEKTHPEYFSLKKNGSRAIHTPRGGYMCFSSEGFIDEVIMDADAFFSGKSSKTRDIKSWPKWFKSHPDQFIIDPNDSYRRCNCAKCRAIYNENPKLDYSEIMFAAIAKIANSVKHHKGKYITTLAYGPKKFPPKNVKIPDNVRVRLCTVGPVYHLTPKTRMQQTKLIKEWQNKLNGKKYCFWLYTNWAQHNKQLHGVVETSPHLISEFIKFLKPYANGVYFENEAICQTYRMLDEYVIMKLLWNPDLDIDELLNDYFSSYYESSSEEIKKFYSILEKLWLQIVNMYQYDSEKLSLPGRPDIWEKVYTTKKITELHNLIEEALKKSKGNKAVSWRINLLKNEMLGRINKHKSIYEKTMSKAGDFVIKAYKTSEKQNKDGFLNESEWERIPEYNMRSSAVNNKTKLTVKHGLNVKTRFKVLWNESSIFFKVKCEEPIIAQSNSLKSRKHDDKDIWKDNELELFFSYMDTNIMSENFFQIIVNDNGIVADKNKKLNVSDWEWESNCMRKIIKNKTSWDLYMVIPLNSLEINTNSKLPNIKFNMTRHRSLKEQNSEFYSWSSLAVLGFWHDSSTFGKIDFLDYTINAKEKSLIKNGDMEVIDSKTKLPANWKISYSKNKYASIDNKTKISGENSLKIDIPVEDRCFRVYQNFDVEPSKSYILDCYIKFENISSKIKADLKHTNIGAYVTLSYPGGKVYLPKPAFRNTRDWTNIKYKFKTADKFSDNAEHYILFRLNNAKGKMWIDDVKVMEAE